MLNKKKIAGTVLSFGILASGGVLGTSVVSAAPVSDTVQEKSIQKAYELDVFTGTESEFQKKFIDKAKFGEKIPAYVKGLEVWNKIRNDDLYKIWDNAHWDFKNYMIEFLEYNYEGTENTLNGLANRAEKLTFSNIDQVEIHFNEEQRNELRSDKETYNQLCEKLTESIIANFSDEDIQSYLSFRRSMNVIQKQRVAQMYETGGYHYIIRDGGTIVDDVLNTELTLTTVRMRVLKELELILSNQFYDMLERKWKQRF